MHAAAYSALLPAVVALVVAVRAHRRATRALAKLRGDLASQVEARTLELSSALERLHQAEKLAALGRFADGVAHEVNSPAAVVRSSLAHLSGAAAARLTPDELEALADARASMEQITALVRRLLDAARVVSSPGLAGSEVPAEIASVVELEAWAKRQEERVRTERGGG